MIKQRILRGILILFLGTEHIVRQFVGFKKQPVLTDAFSKLITVHQAENEDFVTGIESQ